MSPLAESDLEINDTRTSLQSLQPRESCTCKALRGWISAAEWTIYIQQNSVDDERSPSVVSIFRVPNFLKRLKREAYVPRMVSLGPYHHRSAELPPMGSHKGRALHLMSKRFNNIYMNLDNDPNKMDFSDRAMHEIINLENKIRDSYEDKIDCDGNTLARMLTLDGCFVLEILRTLGLDRVPGNRLYYEPLFEVDKIVYTAGDIKEDIVKLENQIPWVVIEKLLKLEFESIDDIKIELLKTLMYLWDMFRLPDPDQRRQFSWPQEQVPHLLGLLHSVTVSPFSDRAEPADPVSSFSARPEPAHPVGPIKCSGAWSKLVKCSGAWCSPIKWRRTGKTVYNVKRIHRAIEVRNAGIKFKPCDGGIGMIKFDPKNATIFLPRITVQDRTEILSRNLIAYEMCKPSETMYFTCYVSLMDELIDSEDDVAVLRKSGIITNYLGSDSQVAELFNSLCKDVTESEKDAFADLKRDVHAHYTNEIKVQIAELMKEHFSSLWRTLAVTGAILILLLTTVQTIFSIHK